MIGWQDPDRAKVQLLWTSAYSSPVHSLSRNLLREICLYLGHYEVYVPAISQHLFRIFNVKSRTVRELYLDVIFSSGAVFCFTRGLEVIVVGGWPAVEDVYTVNEGKAVRQVSMSTARGWPGIYYWEGRLYVFGGNNPPICSCEKRVDGHWLPLPDMAHERYSFNPCLYRTDLWLPDLYPQHKVLESFSLLNEQFRVLPHTLPKQEYSNSIAYMTESHELVVISTAGAYVWADGELCSKEYIIKPEEGIRAYSPCPLLRYGADVYFSNFEQGQLGCFSKEKGTLRVVADFAVVTG